MTSLVTGATGFVGFHVAQQLVARRTPVRLLVRASSRLDNIQALQSPPDSPPSLSLASLASLAASASTSFAPSVASALIETVYGDLTDRESLSRAVQGCDTLYHVAADYRLWAVDPQELYRSNVEGTRQLMEVAREAGVRRIVYTSTVGALGIPHDGTPGTETTPVTEAAMIGHYKRSKFQAEEVVRGFAAEGLPVVIVNPSTPVGERDIKPTPTGQIIVDFLNRRLPAYVDTGLNLIDVRDVAAGILLAGERGRVGERYILGHRNLTLEEMLLLLAKLTGLPAPKVRIPYAVAWMSVGIENLIAEHLLHRAPAHPFEGVKMARYKMFFDASRAVEELGLPQSPVENALQRAVDWFRANGYVHN